MQVQGCSIQSDVLPLVKSVSSENEDTFLGTVGYTILTPIYLVAFAAETLVVTCLKILNFVLSGMGLFQGNPLCLVVDGCIDLLDRAVELLSPWPTSPDVPDSNPDDILDPEEGPDLSNTEEVSPRSDIGPPKQEKSPLFPRLFFTACLVAAVYKFDVIPSILSWVTSFTSIPKCISYHGTPETLEQAKAVFRCENPFNFWADNTNDWQATRSAFRHMSKLLHPDKGGDEVSQAILARAKDFLERAFTTEDGARDLKLYECISQVSTPRRVTDLDDARRIFDCIGVSTSLSCPTIKGNGERILNQISWVGDAAMHKLSYAYNCICLWQPPWLRPLSIDLSHHLPPIRTDY